MNILFISEDIPYPGLSGSSVIGYEFIKFFKKNNHQVSILNPTFINDSEDLKFKRKQLKTLLSEGFNIQNIEFSKKKNKTKKKYIF